MPICRRGCFVKYVLVTFFLLFVYSFFVLTLNTYPNVGSDFVVLDDDAANQQIIAFAQFSDKEQSSQTRVKSNERVVVLQNVTTTARPESYNSKVTAVKLNSNDQQTGAKYSNLRISANSSGISPGKTPIELEKSPVVPQSPDLVKKSSPTSPAKQVQPENSSVNSSKTTKKAVVHSTAANTTTPFPLGDNITWNFTVSNNPHPFKFLKNASNICRPSRSVFVLNIIHSKPSNSLHRNIIRKTWGNATANEKLHTATVFVLGQTNDSKVEAAVDAEYHKYQDIVQEDFLDSYRNLTYKATAVLRWIVNFCPNAEFVLKTDDDVFVNPYDINRLIRRQVLKEPNATKIMCHVANQTVLRGERSKWFVPEKEYPYKRYPPYCMGAAFIMPKSVIPSLYNASYITRFFWIDDVYSTGMLAHIANVSHLDITKKFVYKPTEHRDKLLFGDATIAHVGGGPNVEMKQKVWDEILKIEMTQT